MTSFRVSASDTPEAMAILDDYLDDRAATFPGGGYVRSSPDPSVFTPPRGVFLLAGPEGAPLGCGGIRLIEDDGPGRRYEVKHVFTRPEARGQGIGHALLDELERRARDLGATELVLDTHHSLEAAAALYARHGFTTTPAYNDNPNATRWYRKALDGSLS